MITLTNNYYDFIHSNGSKITLAQKIKLDVSIKYYGYPEAIYFDNNLICIEYDKPGINLIAIDLDGSSHT